MPLILGPSAVIEARVAVGLVYDVPVVQGAAGLDAGFVTLGPYKS